RTQPVRPGVEAERPGQLGCELPVQLERPPVEAGEHRVERLLDDPRVAARSARRGRRAAWRPPGWRPEPPPASSVCSSRVTLAPAAARKAAVAVPTIPPPT